MSSLAAARADNFYYPPDHDPRKGGINKQQGQHPLRERAKKLDQGILVIRFEMPFNVWCTGCGHLIGKGVRFNAEKQAIGAYHSTKIWSFSMTAPCCQQRIVVHTDPKAAEYLVVSGGRRKAETFTPEDAQTLRLPDDDEKAKLVDPLNRLENSEHDKAVARSEAIRMSHLRELNNERYKDDYTANKALRRRLRVVRKDEKARDQQRQALGLPEHVKLLPAAAEDAEAAALTIFGDPHAHHHAWRKTRQGIRTQSIFPGLPASQQVVSGTARGVKRKTTAELAAGQAKHQRTQQSSVF